MQKTVFFFQPIYISFKIYFSKSMLGILKINFCGHSSFKVVLTSQNNFKFIRYKQIIH